MKKVVSLLLVLMMLLSTLVVTASAAYENTYTNTGNQRVDILEVAKTQVGNTNGLKYRSDGADWCAAFIVWCARQANIDSSIIKNTGWATADDLGITYYGRNADRTNTITYIPKPGDVIIFDWSSNGYCYKSPPSFYGDHVGLVEYVENGYVHTIEGNRGKPGEVRRKSYSLSSSEIKGYGVPNYLGGQPVSHTIDSNYSKNFTAYPKAKITAANIFDANHNQIDSTSWIGTSDKCTIHEVYTDGCCKVTYPLDAGGTKTVYSKISLFNVNINECTGYNIAYSYNTENGNFYDSNTVEFTVTPHVNNRDAYDNEISNIFLCFKKPDGEVKYISLGKNKSVEFYMSDYTAGKYIFWAKVETIYGSSEGTEDDGSLSLDLSRLSWSNFKFESDVIYARIKFEGIDRYLTVNADENVVSCERKSSTSSDQSQIWKVIRNSDGTYTIQSVQNNKVLDVSKGSYCRGANVLTYTSQDSENQKWYLSKDSNNNSFIRAAKSNSAVLDVEGGNPENGTNVELWTYHGGDAQKVVFQYPYQIQYNANGGSNPPSNQYKEYGETFTLSTTVPTRTGYTFLGWSTSSSATSASYSAGGSYTANADATLYAVWKANTYTLSYNANGGTGAPSSQTGSSSYTISNSVPTRTGYTFLGWSTSSSATSATYQPGNSITISKNTTLYAVWKSNPKATYTVTYNANGGSVTPSSTSVTEGDSVTLPTPTKAYTLSFNANGGSGAPSAQTVSVGCKGWSTSSVASSGTFSCNATVFPTANTTFYAVWNSSASKVIPSTMPTRSGYNFIGWSRSSLATTATWKAGDAITVTDNTTLYAVWQKIETPTPPPAPKVEYKSVYLDYKSTYSIDVEGFEATEYIAEDDSIISVDSNGRVTAKRPGTADVYVYDANSDVRVVYTFSVDYAWWQWIIIIVLFGWIWY